MSDKAELPYSIQLKNRFDPRQREMWVGVGAGIGAGSVLATIAVNLLGVHTPWQYDRPPTPDTTVTYHDPDTEHRIPGEIAPIHSKRTGGSLTILQPNAPNFVATPLQPEAVARVADFAGDIRGMIHDNPTATITISPYGMASDESYADSRMGDSNLGQLSDNNDNLSMGYIDGPLKELRDELRTEIQLGQVEVGVVTPLEVRLTGEQIQDVDTMAASYGHTRETFLYDYNYAQESLEMSPDDKRKMYSLFDSNRGASFRADIHESTQEAEPCDDVYQIETTSGATHEQVIPGNDGRHADFSPGFIPIIPLLRFRRRRKYGDVREEVPMSLEDGIRLIAQNNAAIEAQRTGIPQEPVTTTESTEKVVEPKTLDNEISETEGEEYPRPEPAVGHHPHGSISRVQKRRQDRIMKQLARERREWKRRHESTARRWTRRASKLSAAAIALIALVPSISGHTEHGKSTPSVTEACSADETEPGSRLNMSVSPFWIPNLIDDAFTGDVFSPPKWDFILTESPDVTTHTVNEYSEIQVDEEGKVVQETTVLQRQTQSRQPAHFGE